ncbi:gamma-aminobutyric acid type B receptor subunit 1-like isoform X2 [Apostichopus japonicus]
MLAEYELQLHSRDTQCDAGRAIDEMYRALYNDSVKYVMILGGACSSVTQPTARSSHYWHLVQMSHASTSPLLRDRGIFPLLFRMWPEDSTLNVVKLVFIKAFGWKRVATIHENLDIFSIPTADFQRQATDYGIDVIAAESFTKDPSLQIANLKRNGARIIIGNFYHNKAIKVFCEAYKQGLYGKGYVWVIIGWFSANWWRDTSDVNCTIDEMKEAVEGYFSVDGDPRNRSPNRGPANISTDEYFALLEDTMSNVQSNDSAYQNSPYGFDSAWAIAMALHQANQELQMQNPPRSIAEFTYNNDVYTHIFDAMRSMNFLGVSGPVTFTDDGGRTGGMVLEQNQGGTEIRVAIYDPSKEEEPLQWIQQDIWQGDGPPPDSTIVEELRITIPKFLFIAMTTLAVGGAILAIFFLAFNIKNRHKRFIKMSSPNLNNLILIGGILAYVSMIFFGIDDGIVSEDALIWMCKGHLWTFVASFSIAYGAMFAKTWRVHRIFTNKKLQKMSIKDHRLYVMIGALLAVDILIFLVWEITDPLKVVQRETHFKLDHNDILRVSLATVCEANGQIYFYGLILSINGVLLMFGAFLAWETRHVTVKALNDSKYIGMSVYTVVVLSFVGAPVALAIDDVALHYALISTFIFFATTLTLCLVFIPKLKDINAVAPNTAFLTRPNAGVEGEADTSGPTRSVYEKDKPINEDKGCSNTK